MPPWCKNLKPSSRKFRLWEHCHQIVTFPQWPPCPPSRKSRNGRHWDSKFGRLSHKSIANTKKVLWSFRKRIEKIRKLSKISIQQYPKIWPKLPHWTIYFWKNNKKSTFCKISEFSRKTPKTNKNIFRNKS